MQPETLGLLVDIRDAGRFIVADTTGVTFHEFRSDRRMRQLVLYNLMIIGEATNQLRRQDQDIAGRISEIPQIVGLRNLLIHRYQTIDYSTVWRTIQVSLPILQAEVEQMLRDADVE